MESRDDRNPGCLGEWSILSSEAREAIFICVESINLTSLRYNSERMNPEAEDLLTRGDRRTENRIGIEVPYYPILGGRSWVVTGSLHNQQKLRKKKPQKQKFELLLECWAHNL